MKKKRREEGEAGEIGEVGEERSAPYINNWKTALITRYLIRQQGVVLS